MVWGTPLAPSSPRPLNDGLNYYQLLNATNPSSSETHRSKTAGNFDTTRWSLFR